MNWGKTNIMQDFLSQYRRGEITKEQFLKNKRFVLESEKKELSVELNQKNSYLASLEQQIAEIDEELKGLEQEAGTVAG